MRIRLESDTHDYTTNDTTEVAIIDDALLRDYFAAQAISCFWLRDSDVDNLMKPNSVKQPAHEVVARFCYGLADAMMAERGK